jgi:hypothetical protein
MPDEPVLPLPSRIAMWCKDAGMDDEQRHEFLREFSHGAYASARDVPASDVKRLRAVLELRKAFG